MKITQSGNFIQESLSTLNKRLGPGGQPGITYYVKVASKQKLSGILVSLSAMTLN